MQTSSTWHRTNRAQIFDQLNIRAFRRSVNRTGQKSIDVDKVGNKKPLASKSCFVWN